MGNKNLISGIICELNPLHHGHKLILDEANRLGRAVCVMSGNYVQRGEPAILDKWYRTRMALQNGAHLVLELPLPWACAGAEKFASGAVHILHAFGLPGHLVFGSEAGEIEKLNAPAQALLSPDFQNKIAERLRKSNETFAKSREAVLSDMIGEESARIVSSPNNILAIEYIKALYREKSALKPATIKRQGAGHGETEGTGDIRSAQEIRQLIYSGEDTAAYVPDSVSTLIEEAIGGKLCPVRYSTLESAILCKLRTMKPSDFALLPDISEGLEYRIHRSVRTAATLDKLYQGIKSKRYPLARIRRLVLSAFLGVKNDLPPLPPYIRVLGMDKIGEELLRSAQPALPVTVKSSDFSSLGGDALRVFELEAAADDLYAMSYPAPRPCGRDYTQKIIKI